LDCFTFIIKFLFSDATYFEAFDLPGCRTALVGIWLLTFRYRYIVTDRH